MANRLIEKQKLCLYPILREHRSSNYPQHLRPPPPNSSNSENRNLAQWDKNQEGEEELWPPACCSCAHWGRGDAHLGVRQAEDARIVGTPHHDFMLLARRMAAGALGAWRLGAVALASHPVAGGVSHGCSSSRGPPAVWNNTGLGTPRQPRQGRPRLRPCAWGPRQGNPRPREAVPGVPSFPGLQEGPNPPPQNPLDARCSGIPLSGTPGIPALTARGRPPPQSPPVMLSPLPYPLVRWLFCG